MKTLPSWHFWLLRAILPLALVGVAFTSFTSSTLAVEEQNSPADEPTPTLRQSSASDALRARLIPVAAEMSEDAIDPSQRVERFDRPADVAFVIEMENVSDTAVKLLDTRYGEGYGSFKGKANSDWLSQFLFSLDLFDAEGSPIAGPIVQVVDINMPLSGALASTLEPGHTHRFLIRPARWLTAKRFHPATSGRYQVAVRYHGLPPAVAAQLAKSPTRRAVLGAVAGDVVTPPVTIEIAALDRDAPPRVWGTPTDGLRAAAAFAPNTVGQAQGTKPDLQFYVQNVSKQPITFTSPITLSELTAAVTDTQRKPVKISSTWYSGWRLTSRVTLQPKQMAVYNAGNLGLAGTEEQADKFGHVTHRKMVAPAGDYHLQLSGHFGNHLLKDGKGKVLAPLAGDWKGKLTTGLTPFELVADRAANAESSEE